MGSIERSIDALGGNCADRSADWNEGYSDGLTDAEAAGSWLADAIKTALEKEPSL